MTSSITHLFDNTSKKYASFPLFSFRSGFRTKTYTYFETFEYIKKIAAFLRANHIQKGDRIVILSYNRPEYAMLIMACLAEGAILVPIDYRTNHETIVKFVKKTQPKAIFTSSVFHDLFEGLSEKIIYFEDLLLKANQYTAADLAEQDKDQLAALLFTSGTTGEPKGTMISYGNILASLQSIRSVFALPAKFRLLSILPLSHALEMFGGFLTAYSYGCHIHYIERINSITIMQALKRYKIQGMAVVPQMLRVILQNVERQLKEDHMENKWNQAQKIAKFLPLPFKRLLFKKLHDKLGGHFSLFACGSAPLEIKLAKIWANTGIQVIEGYGASETTGFISTNSFTRNKLGTVGRILPQVEYKLSQDKELLVKGGNIVSGYFENEAKTKESFENGWFHTGDIVTFDKDGYMQIVGRDKFKIVLSDGKKVYPEDIEKKLNNHPGVVDSTVFGLPASEGEIVHAELIVKNHAKIKEIIASVNALLNPHEQIMDYALWNHSDFPRTKTLKVDRQTVKDEVLKKNTADHSALEKNEEEKDQVATILRTILGKKHMRIENSSILTTDLKLDSLKRIELLALIEEEIGVSINELKITAKTTVLDLKKLIKEGKPVVIEDGEKLTEWQMSKTMENLRPVLQDTIGFPLFQIGFKVKGRKLENLDKIKTPQLFIFNHVGMNDVFNILRIMPSSIRKKTAIAATSKLWHEAAYERYLAMIFANAFPFVKAESHGAMRGNFDRVGELLDKGFHILISPEGNITHTGELLPFHTGAGYIAVEMGVPVTPFKILGYYDLWPEIPKRKLNNFWPVKFGNVEVIVGEPIAFDKKTSYEEATQIMREAIIKL